jgi:hypothetical protein
MIQDFACPAITGLFCSEHLRGVHFSRDLSMMSSIGGGFCMPIASSSFTLLITDLADAASP